MNKNTIGIWIGGIALSLILIVGIMVGWPQYRVWQQGLAGEAALKRANQERQIRIAQAKAEEDAAIHTAKAIEVLGKMVQQYPEYREQEFIQAFADAMTNGDIEKIIYVPTEANIPIIEATRLSQKD